MKNILILVLLLSCSVASFAVPGPGKKSVKKTRVAGKSVSLPLPPKTRR